MQQVNKSAMSRIICSSVRHCGLVVSAPACYGTGCEFDFLAVSDIYPMFIEPTITWVPSGFSGYIWLDTKIVLKKVSELERVSRYDLVKLCVW